VDGSGSGSQPALDVGRNDVEFLYLDIRRLLSHMIGSIIDSEGHNCVQQTALMLSVLKLLVLLEDICVFSEMQPKNAF
jgi:hypothetical protein